MIEEPRLDIAKVAPDAYRHLLEIGRGASAKLDAKVLHLVKLRASQINGCAFCIAMHTEQALKDGEPVERLTALDAWEESPLYDERERAALGLVEAVTRIPASRVPREVWETLGRHYSEEQIGWLTVSSALINAWNRLAIASRLVYTPGFAASLTRQGAEAA